MVNRRLWDLYRFGRSHTAKEFARIQATRVSYSEYSVFDWRSNRPVRSVIKRRIVSCSKISFWKNYKKKCVKKKSRKKKPAYSIRVRVVSFFYYSLYRYAVSHRVLRKSSIVKNTFIRDVFRRFYRFRNVVERMAEKSANGTTAEKRRVTISSQVSFCFQRCAYVRRKSIRDENFHTEYSSTVSEKCPAIYIYISTSVRSFAGGKLKIILSINANVLNVPGCMTTFACVET